MTVSGPDFRQTWLWRQAFQSPRSDSTTEEQEFFRVQYLSIRDRSAQLVSRIAADLPGMTVHDVSHLDALWDTASSVAEGAVNVNPAEAFVLGAAILLHDAAMSLVAYPGGISEIRATVAWKDAVARVALAVEEGEGDHIDVDNPPDKIIRQVVPDVLRRTDLTMGQVERYLHELYRARPEFVYSVSTDFARYCQTPILVLPDETPAHPLVTSVEVASLCPNAEVTVFPWGEPPELKARTINRVRTFLRAHKPMA